jgi:Uncharacterised nucleotidyltransferase
MTQVPELDETGEAVELYRAILAALSDANIPFVVGGAYALERIAGFSRRTKDLDLFVMREDWPRVENALTAAGINTHLEFAHWLAKASRRSYFVDLIFAGGNGHVRVDSDWFKYGIPAEVLGAPVLLCAPEETIWSKAFVMERERFDGADVLHVLRRSAQIIDWHRLLNRFGDHSSVLLAHLVLFKFVYPDAAGLVPDWVQRALWARHLAASSTEHLCRGTLLSRAQYLVDVHGWGYMDARVPPHGAMSAEQIEKWSAAIEPGLVPSPA